MRRVELRRNACPFAACRIANAEQIRRQYADNRSVLKLRNMYSRSGLWAFAVGILMRAPIWSQAPKAVPAPPSIRQEILTVFDGAARRAVALAEAMPQEKFAWRPMNGVRSFGEVCMHMAGSTFLFLSYAGLKPPAGPAQDLAAAYMKRGFELPELFAAEAAVKDKTQIVAAMKQAFEQARDYIQKVPEADLVKPVQFFERKTTIHFDIDGRTHERTPWTGDRLRPHQSPGAAVVAMKCPPAPIRPPASGIRPLLHSKHRASAVFQRYFLLPRSIEYLLSLNWEQSLCRFETE